MRLYITNKNDFDKYFSEPIEGLNYSSKKIHQIAFNELQSALADGNIPLYLIPDCKYTFCSALFTFKSKKEDVYFYEFVTSIS